MFHVSEGLFFERLNVIDEQKKGRDHEWAVEYYGGVRIIKRKDGNPSSPIIFEQVLTAGEWSSVVASMTALGESAQTWGMILALQK